MPRERWGRNTHAFEKSKTIGLYRDLQDSHGPDFSRYGNLGNPVDVWKASSQLGQAQFLVTVPGFWGANVIDPSINNLAFLVSPLSSRS